MKTCLLGIIFFFSATMSADPLLHELKPSKEKKLKVQASKKRDMLVITGAKIIPLIEFLGLPNVNHLPPTSAGETKSIDDSINTIN